MSGTLYSALLHEKAEGKFQERRKVVQKMLQNFLGKNCDFFASKWKRYHNGV